jgi:hypothetical protein
LCGVVCTALAPRGVQELFFLCFFWKQSTTQGV